MACPADEELLRQGGGDEIAMHLRTCAVCRARADELATVVGGATWKPPVTPNDPTGLAPGTHVDQFHVVREIGQGSSARVYEARDMRLGRRVALKLLEHGPSSAEGIVQWMDEARAIAKFDHPNIVAIYTAGVHAGRVYLALEYVEGPTLRERLRQGPVAVEDACRILLAIAGAVAEAHRVGVLHRDLKPANVLLAERLRVVDFGLATASEAHCGSTRSGTPAYMAPEQWQDRPVSEATDVWALGVLAYELLVGERPFISKDATRLAQLVCSDQEPDWSALSGIAQTTRELMHSALRRDPGARPDAGTFAAAFAEEVGQKVAEAPVSSSRAARAPWAVRSKSRSDSAFPELSLRVIEVDAKLDSELDLDGVTVDVRDGLDQLEGASIVLLVASTMALAREHLAAIPSTARVIACVRDLSVASMPELIEAGASGVVRLPATAERLSREIRRVQRQLKR